ncbi:phage terminase large subunit family protein [Fodinicurvata sp. EGI_FJ10296]|uniref:phage terminase large subunit family protein n=1 Tax=Fodinicurvata sp. EGI_FJ10296 TaxID=3231908 RepID=UPI0034540484
MLNLTWDSGTDPALADVDSLLKAAVRGVRPEPRVTVTEWAEQYRRLSSRASAEPGRWDTGRTPYLREIMDQLSTTSPVQRIILMKSSQVGGTEAGNNWIGYVVHRAPGPMMAVSPTVQMAKRNGRQRIKPLIEETPVLSELIRPPRERDSGNTELSKEFPGGVLVLTGANSASALRSMPARYLMLDEVDAYPGDVDDEGDPVQIAEVRTKTYRARRKVFLVSSPTITGASKIESEYEASDQRRYFVPCPDCGHCQHLVFAQLRWDPGRPETAAYACADCGTLIPERHKTAMLADGVWRATAECNDPATAGYHINALYSPAGWESWADLARKWEAATTDEGRKVFFNTALGLTFQVKGEAPEWERLYDRREEWAAAVPAGVLVITIGVDVQGDRLELSVWGWGRGLESWWLDHHVIDHGPHTPEAWDALTAYLDRNWVTADGAPLKAAMTAIDSGEFTNAVYAYVRRRRSGKIIAVKGIDSFSQVVPVWGPTYVDVTEAGVKRRRGVRLWKVASSAFKVETYDWLRLARPTEEERAEGVVDPPGTVHVPRHIGAEPLKQLVAEELVRTKGRHGKLQWQKRRDRNETLDCRVYARAAAAILGADRWQERIWARLESQIRDAAGECEPLPPGAAIADPAPDAGETSTPDGNAAPTPKRKAGLIKPVRPPSTAGQAVYSTY